jgi:hypothetical protein
LAWRVSLRDNLALMPARPNLLSVMTEFIVLLLGAILVLLALMRTVGVPSKTIMLILGAILVYWALRAWMKKESASARLQTHIRAGSMAIVGLLMITMPLAPLSLANLLVITAGITLIVRGLLVSLLSLRRA